MRNGKLRWKHPVVFIQMLWSFSQPANKWRERKNIVSNWKYEKKENHVTEQDYKMNANLNCNLNNSRWVDYEWAKTRERVMIVRIARQVHLFAGAKDFVSE